MSLHTNRWHMAYFLCNFQGFPLLWAASAKMLKKLQFPCFSHCSKASLLWFHCAEGTKPSFFRPLPRFPAEFEHVTTYKQMAYGLFSLQFSRFSFASTLPTCSTHPTRMFEAALYPWDGEAHSQVLHMAQRTVCSCQVILSPIVSNRTVN